MIPHNFMKKIQEKFFRDFHIWVVEKVSAWPRILWGGDLIRFLKIGSTENFTSPPHTHNLILQKFLLKRPENLTVIKFERHDLNL